MTEAAHLLVGVQPGEGRGLGSSGRSGEIAQMYRDLMDALRLNQISVVGRASPAVGDALLRPSDVMTWARDRRVLVPPQLADIAAPEPSRVELKERIAQLEAQLAVGGGAAIPLGKRERDSLLVMILAIAREADIDLTKPYVAAKKIAPLTDALGASLTERTIADHLARALELFEELDRSPRR